MDGDGKKSAETKAKSLIVHKDIYVRKIEIVKVDLHFSSMVGDVRACLLRMLSSNIACAQRSALDADQND